MGLKKITHRQPVIQHAMAMVTPIGPGSMHSYYDLVPMQAFAQVFGIPCHGANGQPFELSHHFLAFVHGVETLHPKHNLDLDFQRQHAAKQFVPGVD